MSKWKCATLQISAIFIALLTPIPALTQTDNPQPFKVTNNRIWTSDDFNSGV